MQITNHRPRMPTNPNKFSQFWQELKRRNVIKVIAMYAGSAYVLIELANNVVEPLNLPDWTPRLVIIIALIGFPIILILSWIFDITSEGIDKTKSIGELSELEQVPSSGLRRLKVSDIIITVLVVVVGILLYPRIFGNTNLRAMTMPVTVVNEFGEKETRRVYKKDYMARLCVFPFRNETKDTVNDWLQYGIPVGVREDLFQFLYINPDDDFGANNFQEQLRYAKINNNTHFLSGAINVNNGVYEITSRLHQVANGEIKAERFFKSSDLFSIIDSISLQTRIDLGISELILNSTPDISISELLTENMEAYRIFIEGGIYHGEYFADVAFISAYPSFELDSTFAYAMWGYARRFYGFQISKISALKAIEQAMRHRYRLSDYRETDIRRLYYMIQGDYEKALALTEMQLSLRPFDINVLLDLIDICQINLLLDKFEKTACQLNELIPDHSYYQIELARAYLFTGRLDKGLRVLKRLVKENPENVAAMMKLGEFFLHKKELEAAEEVYNKVILLTPEEEKYISMMLDHIAYIRNSKNDIAGIESVAGNYRAEEAEQRQFLRNHNNHLLMRAETQHPFFLYPISDTVFVALINLSNNEILCLTETFVQNNQGKVLQLISEQSNVPSLLHTYWKEDSLILDAKKIMNGGNISKTINAFQVAYEQNSEHYYLANFIQHLEFIQSPESEKQKTSFAQYMGKYGDLVLYTESNQFYYNNDWGEIYQLLPLSEGKFMIPSKYNIQLHVLNEKDTVSGLKLVYRDGEEDFFPRTN